MRRNDRLFIGIVLALLGGCGGTDDARPEAWGDEEIEVAQLIPILDGPPMQPSAPREPEPPAAEPAPPRAPRPEPSNARRGADPAGAASRVRVRPRRRPIREAWITGGSAFPDRPWTAARRAALYKPAPFSDEPPPPPRTAPVLRAGPRW